MMRRVPLVMRRAGLKPVSVAASNRFSTQSAWASAVINHETLTSRTLARELKELDESMLHTRALKEAMKHFDSPVSVTATEFDMTTAKQHGNLYQKVLLLVNHVEASGPHDDRLSGRGSGQALDLARVTSTHCNEDTGLLPELVVLANLQRCVQTTIKGFPYHTPLEMNPVPWICHPMVQGHEDENDILRIDSGMHVPHSMVHSKADLLYRSKNFVEWLRSRPERVIVVSSHTTWLQAFSYTLNCSPTFFQHGEMRAIGISF